MPDYVAILEDDPRRLTAMRECVTRHLPKYEIATFDNADEMIVWLEDHLGEVVLISLDHDLPLVQMRDGQRVDAGTGRMVADWLCEQRPVCPVIVHTSNENFGPGMMRVLRDGGWVHVRVYPHADCDWIGTVWAEEIGKLLARRSD